MTSASRLRGTGIIRDLIAAPELGALEHLHLASLTPPVRDAALVSDIEEVSSARPDTLIILGSDAARGGWMVSAALRYAWERRACGLVVPSRSSSPTVIELARRLGISLFAFDGDMTSIALAISVQIGVARAGALGRIRAFTLRLAEISDLGDALGLISLELEGACVQLETNGPVTMNSRADIPSNIGSPQENRNSTSVRTSDDDLQEVRVHLAPNHADFLTTRVPGQAQEFACEVLQAASPAVRALLADARLASIRDSLPIMSLISSDEQVDTDDPSVQFPNPASLKLGWPISGGYCAVCLRTKDKERIGHSLHRMWGRAFADVPLAEFADGWLAFVPVSGKNGVSELTARLVESCVHLHPHLFTFGVSSHHGNATEAATSAREAWHAARMGVEGGAPVNAVVSYSAMLPHLPGRLMDPALASSIAEQIFPRLLADPGANAIIAAVLASLEHRGSTVAAAEELGVHRNTLQARLRRAQELGLDLSDPHSVLAIHLVLSGLRRRV